MQKFLKYLGLFLLPILIISVSLEVLLRKIPNDYSYKKEYLDKNAGKINVLFLGNSHAYFGINPDYITRPSFNAALQSQSLQFDMEIVRKYDSSLNNLKTIAIPISYHSLFSTLESGVEYWKVKDYMLYYDMNSSHKIADYSEVLNNNLKIDLTRIYGYYIKHKNNIGCSDLGWGTNFWGKDSIESANRERDMESSAVVAAKRHTSPDDRYLQENIVTLKEFIKYAKDRKIRVILYTTPATHNYVARLNKKQLEKTMATVNSLVAENNTVVTYANFLNDPAFSDDDFADADHLNPSGAEKFSLKINDLINQ